MPRTAVVPASDNGWRPKLRENCDRFGNPLLAGTDMEDNGRSRRPNRVNGNYKHNGKEE